MAKKANGNGKGTNAKTTDDLVGQYVTITALDGIRSWEGELAEINDRGAMVSYESRGFLHLNFVGWAAIASIDGRTPIEGKAAKAPPKPFPNKNASKTAAA